MFSCLFILRERIGFGSMCVCVCGMDIKITTAIISLQMSTIRQIHKFCRQNCWVNYVSVVRTWFNFWMNIVNVFVFFFFLLCLSQRNNGNVSHFIIHYTILYSPSEKRQESPKIVHVCFNFHELFFWLSIWFDFSMSIVIYLILGGNVCRLFLPLRLVRFSFGFVDKSFLLRCA